MRTHRTRRVLAVGVALVGALFAQAAGAADETPMNRVQFSVEASQEVANDWIRATVAYEAENVDAAKLANEVNTAMSWALQRARKAQGVKPSSAGYQTSPVYQDGKIRRWRASQALILEGSDADAITTLVGELQSRLQLRSFQFSVSPSRRREAEAQLTEEVLAAFRARAEIIRRALDASSYQIAQISIDTHGFAPRPRPMMRGAVMAAEAAPPAVEGGSSQVLVRAQGSIELE